MSHKKRAALESPSTARLKEKDDQQPLISFFDSAPQLKLTQP